MSEREFIKKEIIKLGSSIFALLPMFDEKDFVGIKKLTKKIINISNDFLSNSIYLQEDVINLIQDINNFVVELNCDVENMKKIYVRKNVLTLRSRVSLLESE